MPLEAGRHTALSSIVRTPLPAKRYSRMNSPLTRSSRWLAPSMLAALLVLTGSAQAPANTQLPAGSVVPSERHRSVARRVGSMLEGMHYSQSKLDDKLSAIVYTRY